MRFTNLRNLNSEKRKSDHSTASFVREFVDALLYKCINDGASDLHFEPYEESFRIRYRVDGNLLEIPHKIDSQAETIVSRIKVMARLNIAECRTPQDGRIQIPFEGNSVDTRVSTLPTKFGESVVLRFLDQSKVLLNLNTLGMPEPLLLELRDILKEPNGIFLTTGPTGSGKTTTLYSALAELNTESRKILTAEDPVEFEIDGIVQAQTRASINLSFGRLLRSFLRHDPDTILLGEIRDAETANIAIQASLTGHLVFSSLHTIDASGAVIRLVDIGVEPYLVAASLIGVLAQRLVRRLNAEFSKAYVPDVNELSSVGISQRDLNGRFFYRPKADVENDLIAYRGRIGIWELLVMNDRLREAITDRKSHLELKKIAVDSGMRTLKDDGIRILFEGQSSFKEVDQYILFFAQICSVNLWKR